MPISINGTGTITGISVGGLPDGCISEADLSTAAVTTDKIAAGAVTTPKITGGPAFSAKPDGGGQSLTANILTKILFNTEEFDTANCFASSRFTPNVAGHYQINSTVSGGSAVIVLINLHKNGGLYKRGSQATGGGTQSLSVSAVVYLNGTTDYVEIFAQSTSNTTVNSDPLISYFDGFLARPA